jgi:hypothetical protein
MVIDWNTGVTKTLAAAKKSCDAASCQGLNSIAPVL